jgi:Zn-dependent protease
MRQGTALTAIAGPASNLVLALLAIIAQRIYLEVGQPQGGAWNMARSFFESMFSLNILLAVFNMFPLPPLDGSHLLPRSMDPLKEKLARVAPLLFLGLFFVPLPGIGAVGHVLMKPIRNLIEDALSTILTVGS